nr:hypothetical protein [Halomonas sp. HL-48]
MGNEAYVSPEGLKDRRPNLVQLEHEQSVEIPAGQFAFLLTREIVTVPHDLIAFINMKNGLKSSGLVNVSGFHVDPGYKGRLVFAVFNAGPKKITVRQNDAAFLIWFARLEGATESYSRKKKGFMKIESELIARVPEESASLNSLTARIERLETKLYWGRTILISVGGFFSATVAGFLAGKLTGIF